MRRALHRLAGEERGVALVLALITMAILAGTTAALVLPGAVDQRNSYNSANARQAFALAQAALAYGEGAVYAAGESGTSPPIGVTQTIPAQPGGGTGTWSANVAGDGYTWTVYATGTVQGVSRSVHAVATDPSSTQVMDPGVWNYVYADASGTCATNISGKVTISVPIMLRGDLCLGGSVNFTGSQLEVGGNLTVGGSANIGSASKPINTLKVGLTTTSTSTCQSVAPGTGACNGKRSPIYATTVGEGVDTTPEMPCIGQPSSYDPQCTGANNGTWTTLKAQYNAQAAAAKTNCPANLFDNDSTLNNSDTSISSVMFGSTDYDCKVGSNEIKWTHSTGTLAVSGTFYFDGSLTISSNVTYTGQASLYFTGGVSTTGSPSFCGIANCTSSWDPDTNGIIMIAGCWANSTGSSLTTSGCVSLGGNSTAQFGVYCTTNYSTSGGASNMGPVLSNSLSLGGNAQSLIPFHDMPPGTPENYRVVSVPAQPPTDWSG